MSTTTKTNETQMLSGVPNDRVDEIVTRLKKSPRYVSHMVVPDDDKHSTIIVVLKGSGG